MFVYYFMLLLSLIMYIKSISILIVVYILLRILSELMFVLKVQMYYQEFLSRSYILRSKIKRVDMLL